jgi:hypothetical protein
MAGTTEQSPVAGNYDKTLKISELPRFLEQILSGQTTETASDGSTVKYVVDEEVEFDY